MWRWGKVVKKKTSGESEVPAVAEKGKEEKGRGRESRRVRVGERCSETNTPVWREMLCVRVTRILRAGYTLTYSSNSSFMLLCSSLPADFLICTYPSSRQSSSVIVPCAW